MRKYSIANSCIWCHFYDKRVHFIISVVSIIITKRNPRKTQPLLHGLSVPPVQIIKNFPELVTCQPHCDLVLSGGENEDGTLSPGSHTMNQTNRVTHCQFHRNKNVTTSLSVDSGGDSKLSFGRALFKIIIEVQQDTGYLSGFDLHVYVLLG